MTTYYGLVAFAAAALFGNVTAFAAQTAPASPERPALGVVMSQAAGPATVLEVVAGSPADRAGIVEGDRILSIDQQPTESFHDVIKRVAAFRPGQSVTIHVQRGLLRGDLKAVLATDREAFANMRTSSPDSQSMSSSDGRPPAQPSIGLSGSYDQSDEGVFARPSVASSNSRTRTSGIPTVVEGIPGSYDSADEGSYGQGRVQ